MRGGTIKMSKIAKEQITRSTGTDWQPTEEQEQAYLFQWAMLMTNRFPELSLLFHIPNGGARSLTEAVRFKRAGVKKGVPDLFLPVARGGFHGLFIELKRERGGRVSKEQKEWLSALEAEKYRAVVCNGAEEACNEIYNYLTDVEQ